MKRRGRKASRAKLSAAQKAVASRRRREQRLRNQQRERDPFEVIGAIPRGLTYQWVAETVLGSSGLTEVDVETMRAGGWKPVPAHRHPKMRKYRANGRIVVNGQVLVQRGERLTRKARERDDKIARSLIDSHRQAFGEMGGGQYGTGGWATIKDAPSGNVEGIDDLHAKAKIEAEALGKIIMVPFPVLIEDKDILNAATIGTTVAEYKRRQALMTREICAAMNYGQVAFFEIVSVTGASSERWAMRPMMSTRVVEDEDEASN